MKKIFSIFAAIIFAGSIFAADTRILSNANIVAAGAASNSYANQTITDDEGDTWNAYAIKNKHSNATADKHYLQIKKYASSTAYYLQVPELGTKISTIEVTVSGANKPMGDGGNTQTLFFSASNETSATGTGVASATGDASVTLDCSDLDLNTGYITAGGAVRIWEVVVTYETTAPAVAKPTITPEANPFLGSTPVTLDCTTPGVTIYYTLDGSDPDNTSNEYDNPFVINATTTVKAIAYDGTNWSEIASKEITGLTVLSTMDAIFEAAGATASTQYIAFNDWIVTGVSSNGKNVFVTDGTKGFVINDGNGEMGFKQNDVLSGTVQVSLQKYKGYAQVTGLKATTTGLTVDEGGVPTLNVLDADGIALLKGVNTGSLIQIKGVYSTTGANKHFVAGVQVFSAICGSYPDFEDADYTVTGVYQQYDDVKEILPRALTDIEEDVAGGAIKADDIALGEVWVVDDNPYETIRGLSVAGINLTEAIVASTSSEGLTIVSETLTEYGGSIEVEINAPLGVFAGTISLTSGDLIKVVNVTATVRKKNEEPATAVDPIVDPDKGTSASEATVIIEDTGDEYDGVKVGKTDADGSLPIVVGAGAQTLYFYALAWNGAAGNIQLVAPAGVTISAPELDADGKIALMASAGIKQTSPFTVDDIAVEDLYQCLYAISLSGVTAETTITVSSGTARRFVIFGIKQVGGETPTALEDVAVENTAVKQIINNQVIITRDGVRYNVIGQIVK